MVRRLTFFDRQKLEFYSGTKLKIRRIATLMGKDHSVISRELRRNRGQFGPYRAIIAQAAANRKARITNKRKLLKDERLREWVGRKLDDCWSPEQIAGRLKSDPPPNLRKKNLCHETIYQHIYKEEPYYYHNLRRSHSVRRKRYGRKTRKINIPGRVSIHDRPIEVQLKERFGDWESDTVIFRRSRGMAISVQYERKGKLVRITRIHNQTARETRRALEESIGSLPQEFWKTISFDNGKEGVCHTAIRDKHQIQTFFCDPYKSWQKGGVENINGLIRQYLPRRTDLTALTDNQIYQIQEELNNRPRKSLNYLTPNEVLQLELKKVVQ